MRLTIAIPTFNRPDEIVRALSAVLPQCGVDDDVLVLDNASPVPVEGLVGGLRERFPGVALRVVRHPVNVGGAANLVRCFEEAGGDFVWLLGDDDHITADAVQQIRAAIAAVPRADYFNFATDTWRREQRVESTGVSAFLQGLDDWSNLLFMTAGVYRVAPARRQVRIGYHFQYSMAPHVAMLLAMLGDEGTVILETARVVEWHSAAEWSPLNAYVGFPTLLDLPLPADAARALRSRLRDSVLLPRALAYLLRYVEAGMPEREARTIWQLIRVRLFAEDQTLSDRLVLAGGRLALGASRVSTPIIRQLLRLARRVRPGMVTLDDFVAHGRYAR